MNHKIVVLGSGLAGISISYHIGHNKCIIFEAKHHVGGHIYSYKKDGFIWDEGPHVSFTKSEYVRNLFSKISNNSVLDYEVNITNYYNGSWIPHPAQTNLWALNAEQRQIILRDFNESRARVLDDLEPCNYQEWLQYAFGSKFTKYFSEVYTKKYWTVPAKKLTTDWVGSRVFYPNIEDVNNGSVKPLDIQTHYITRVRYPSEGGFFSFARDMYNESNIDLNHKLKHISFINKVLEFENGVIVTYDTLINTIPLPELIRISDASEEIKQEAEKLSCSSVLLVNVTANHETRRKENWIYVYNSDFLSTRLYCTEIMSPNNAPKKNTGIQVEVYFSKFKPKTMTDEEIAQKVVDELILMQLIDSRESILNYHTKWVQWANVIFDHERKGALNKIFTWLVSVGYSREADDLEAMTNWDLKFNSKEQLGNVILAGRYAQWKYYWSDDCLLRGKYISSNL